MSVNGASTIFSFASSVVYVPIGCSHPFSRFWQPLLGKTTASCSLLNSENVCQRIVNSFSCCIFGNQGMVQIFMFISELLLTLIGKNTIYQRWNTDSELCDIGSCRSIQNCNIRCWKCNFAMMLLTNSKNKTLIWMYRWTRWATCWQPVQFRCVGSLPSNRMQDNHSVLLTTQTANVATVMFGPGPGPEVTVRNGC
jgi:hypothetical protein